MPLPEPVGQAALAFVQKLLGPVGEVGELLTDKVRFYRWRSALNTLEKARTLAGKRKIKPTEVPLKFLVPFLEAASLEEEQSPLEDMWAELLSGAMKDRRLAKTVFVDTLRSLSADEVSVLNSLVTEKIVKTMRKAPGFGEISPAMVVSSLTTMWRIQLADHVEKSVLYMIEHFEEDLSAEAGQVEEFLTALAMHDNQLVKVENIVASDRAGSHSYSDDDGSMKTRWRKTLKNKALLGANLDLISHRAELDALTARGLVDRTFHTFDAYDGHGFFALVSPTPLGVEFVCACRGKPLPYPPQDNT